ncbi:unnamed protein product [Lepeophtheirus salmonis]|uniref:(salmon louse) hypothetical protein n=1 Tax=Lepeophtheirus salmonis TaxID=72036 RepID=A0A7R8CB37_LEPSM|nr:unnamed protein product [Lepeophtheirus salmonis]CAF2757017.1 unnamed protein product [Lepeophtheirus salmonis]
MGHWILRGSPIWLGLLSRKYKNESPYILLLHLSPPSPCTHLNRLIQHGGREESPLQRLGWKNALLLHDPGISFKILRDLNDYLLLSGQESQGYFLDEGSNEEKRGGTGTPFNAWGGKRKVTPFNAWAGKRSIYLDGDDEEAFKANRYKRASEDMTRDPNERKYAKMSIPFSAWGGKRGLLRFARNVNVPSLKVMRPARAVFSAWGGK